MNIINSNNLSVDSLGLYKLTITSSGKEDNFQSCKLLQLGVPKVYRVSWPGSVGTQGESISLFFIWLFSSSNQFLCVNCSGHAVFFPVFFRKHLLPGQSVNGSSA